MGNPPLPAARFFGFYLQSVDKRDGQRWQWLVLPPVKNDQLGSLSGRICWWERTQFLTAPRPKWAFRCEGVAGNGTLESRVSSFSNSGAWITCEPVVVKVYEDEVVEWVKERSTPYGFISRLEKRAARLNIRIQGPTSIPQVVTAPPSS